MNKSLRGFTIVEILVVIAVIGIITTISVMSFSRYQATSRDTVRSSKSTTIAEALEKYYEVNGEYPSCTALTGSVATIQTDVLKNIDPTALVTPKAPGGTTNSISCSDLTNVTTDPDIFSYTGDGSADCATGASCLQYTLKYKDEVTGTIKTITSRRSTDFATSNNGITDLVAASYNFTQINLTWSAVSNSVSYNIDRATNNTFTTGLTSFTSSTNSYSSTGLTGGVTYYYRVKAIASNGSGGWSNVANATTANLSTPVATAVADSDTQITVTWPAVTSATSYTVQWSTTSAFTTFTTIAGITTPRQYVLTGLVAGNTRYFRVQANASGDDSSYSAVVNATTAVPKPTGLVANATSNTAITASWNPVSVANTYKLQYSTSSTFASGVKSVTVTHPTVSKSVTGLTQGYKYYFRVYALVGTVSSVASSTANETLGVTTPGTPTVSVAMGGIRAYSAGRWIVFTETQSGNWYYAQGGASVSCPSGSTAQYKLGANYNNPTTFYGWTGWDDNSAWYMVRPYSGYTIRFTAVARCVSAQGVASGQSAQGYSGYLGP